VLYIFTLSCTALYYGDLRHTTGMAAAVSLQLLASNHDSFEVLPSYYVSSVAAGRQRPKFPLIWTLKLRHFLLYSMAGAPAILHHSFPQSFQMNATIIYFRVLHERSYATLRNWIQLVERISS
jgi:hypothetical protein